MIKINSKQRALLGAKIREDRRLTGKQRSVMEALLFKYMNGDGDAWPGYEALAISSGCSVKTAKTAIKRLIELGYITKKRRWGGRRYIKRNGRWIPNCITNLYHICMVVFENVKSVISTQKPRDIYKKNTPNLEIGSLSEGLQAALARLGHAIADKSAGTGVQIAS